MLSRDFSGVVFAFVEAYFRPIYILMGTDVVTANKIVQWPASHRLLGKASVAKKYFQMGIA